MKLVIIAAGQGSRLRSAAGQINKTILEIGDRSLMEYLLANARICAVEGCVVVTGYRSQAIEDFLDGLDTDLQIETVHNPHWRQPNGISVLAARPFIGAGEDFLVTMSDHLYEPALLRAVLNSQLEDTIANVALDFNIDAIFDIDDGMKVAVDGDNRQTITAMSKTLQRYDAIDCGVFKCGYEFFNYLDQAAAAGRGSLADACNALIPSRQLGGVDVGSRFWLDIDTPAALEHGRRQTDHISSWYADKNDW